MRADHIAKSLDLLSRAEPPMAMCPRCPDEPLVSTFDRPRYEFHCMGCGGWFGFLDPRPAPDTPELSARQKARAAEYEQQRPDRD